MHNEYSNLQRTARILLVEDSPSDQLLITRALEDSRVGCEMLILDDGKKTLQLLRREPPYDDQQQYPTPDLILMDINMPIMDGTTAVKLIRADDRLPNIPIIMLTTSAEQADVNAAYEAGANAYIAKPVDYSQLIDILKKIDRFWFHLVVLPETVE